MNPSKWSGKGGADDGPVASSPGDTGADGALHVDDGWPQLSEIEFDACVGSTSPRGIRSSGRPARGFRAEAGG